MDNLAPSHAQSPFLRGQSLTELLAWHDVDFVRCAYVTLLGRQPDPEGEAVYTAMIRSGQSKLKVLCALRQSAEGREHDPGIGGLDLALRNYRRSTMPVLGWLFRGTDRGHFDDKSSRLRRLENLVSVSRDQLKAVIATLSDLSETGKSAEQHASVAVSETRAVQAILTSFVGEFRAFRDEQAARFNEQTARFNEQMQRTNEQARAAAEEAQRARADAEHVQKILTSFVGEFRAFRDEVAMRSRTELDSVRALKTSFANEFDALRSEQAMRSNELRDLINVSFDNSFRDQGTAPQARNSGGNPETAHLGPRAGRIVSRLKSNRSYAV